jgi:hypothetical protein
MTASFENIGLHKPRPLNHTYFGVKTNYDMIVILLYRRLRFCSGHGQALNCVVWLIIHFRFLSCSSFTLPLTQRSLCADADIREVG